MIENWYLAEVHDNREAAVAFTLRCLAIEPFLPLSLQTERISARTRRQEIIARPALLGYVFFRASLNRVQDANDIRDVKRIFADDAGRYITVPDAQMDRFMASHDRWQEKALQAHMSRRKMGSAGPKKKFVKLTPEILKDFMKTHFNVHDDLEAA